MNVQKKRAFKVGIFVFSAISILILSIYLIGSKNNLFKSKTTIYCVFDDIKGVVEGNNVRFSGINVGSIRAINITSDSTVVMSVAIAEEYAKYIYKNSIAEINLDGIMGGKILSISAGSSDFGRIIDGDTLISKNSIDVENMLNMSSNILVNVDNLVKSLLSVSEKFNNGKGDLSALLNENRLTTDLNITLEKLNSTLGNLDEISGKINSGKGDLGELVNSKKLVTELSLLLQQLNSTSNKANEILDEFKTTATNLNSGNGSVNQFINSPNFANRVDSTLQNLNNSLEYFNGTAKAIEKSWILNVFTKKDKKDNVKKLNDTNQ